jgi:putative ABC transport system permease protein
MYAPVDYQQVATVPQLRVVISRFLDLLFRRRRAQRLDEEIAAHLAALAQEFEDQGMSAHAAALEARRTFGNVDSVRMLHREQRGLPMVDRWSVDLRAATRLLTREKAFTTGVVLVLALGLAVNTTIFTIVNGMTWRTLPVPGGDHIMHLSSQSVQERTGMYTSFADFNDWRSASTTFSEMGAYATAAMNVGDSERPADRLAGAFVSTNLFRVLQVQPALGREFTEDDARPGAEPVALLGHHIWSARYGADPSLIGRAIRIGGEPVTIIGVMPAGFQFPLRGDVWQPIAQMPSFDPLTRDARRFDAVGRLTPKATLDAARAEMTAIAASIAQQHPASNFDVGVRIVPFTHAFVAPPPEAQEPLLMMIAAAVVLLIACANGASLLLARANQRAREMTLRATLGASRARIVQQLLLEALLMSTAAGALGLVISLVAVQFFAREAVDLNLPYWIAFEFDARVFAYVAVACLGTAIAFGLLPAWQLSRSNAQDILKDGGRGIIGGRRGRRWASVLLAGEIALTVMLLAAGALLLRMSATLGHDDEVIDLDRLFAAQLAVPVSKYAAPAQQRALHRSLEEQLTRPEGFAAATVSSARPFVDSTTWELRLADKPLTTERGPSVQSIAISPSYFHTLGLPLLRGRGLLDGDSAPGREAVVVNDHFVQSHMPDGDPIGRRIQLREPRNGEARGSLWYTIVGVSPSVRQRPLSRPAPLVYVPLGLHETRTLAITVRASGDATSTATALRDGVRAVDADVAAYAIMSLRKLSALSRWTARLVSVVLVIFAGIAVVLSAAGLYGVTSYGFAQRTSEIGLRVAVGARHSQIAWTLLRSTLTSAMIGLALGLGGAFVASQVLRGAIVQSETPELAVLGGIALLLVVIVVAACFVPTRRAMRLDPVTALRHE